MNNILCLASSENYIRKTLLMLRYPKSETLSISSPVCTQWSCVSSQHKVHEFVASTGFIRDSLHLWNLNSASTVRAYSVRIHRYSFFPVYFPSECCSPLSPTQHTKKPALLAPSITLSTGSFWLMKPRDRLWTGW